MATPAHGKNAKFYLTDSGSTERDLSSALTDVTLTRSADTAETSGLGDVAKSYVAGLKDNTVKIEGNRDTTIEGYIEGVVAVSTVFAYCPEGSATGKIKYSGTVIGTSYEPSSSVSDANKFTADFQVSGTITRTVLP
jgi:hypothetical protein